MRSLGIEMGFECTNPVILYVNLMLFAAAGNADRTLELRRDSPLPDVGEGVPTPDMAKVVNRLKVMCGLNPVTLAKATEGQIRFNCLGKDFLANCRFDDAGEVKCSIRIHEKDAQHAAAG